MARVKPSPAIDEDHGVLAQGIRELQTQLSIHEKRDNSINIFEQLSQSL